LLDTDDEFAFLNEAERRELRQKLSVAGLFDRPGTDMPTLQSLLDTDEFAFLNHEERRHLHGSIFIARCTEIECRELGKAAETDAEVELYARAMKKFTGIGVAPGQVENPFKEALKQKWEEVRLVFGPMCLVSTMDDPDWYEADVDEVGEAKLAVITWANRLGPVLCRQRMEHYLDMTLPDDCRSVLVDFQDLFNRYCEARADPDGRLRAAADEREALGQPRRATGGVQGAARPDHSPIVATTLKVVCMRK